MPSYRRPTSRNYAGRQLDVELLKHVEETLPVQRVDPDASETPRMVSGIEKCVQRYAKLFLTILGSVKSDPEIGSDLLRECGAGMVNDEAYLDHLCSVASTSAVVAMKADDDDPDRFGEIPDDERLYSVDLDEISIDQASGRAHVKATIETYAGDDFTFIVPVDSGISA